MPHPTDSVPLVTLDTRGEAEMLCAVLGANGFRAVVQEKTFPRMSSFVLRVVMEDAVPAAEFLRDRLNSRPDEDVDRCLACDAELAGEEEVCPDCGWTFLEGAAEESQ